MKKLLLIALLVFAAAPRAGAAGSVTAALSTMGVGPNYFLKLTWTGDASTGAVPATVVSTTTLDARVQGYQIQTVEIVPGTPAPTAAYAVTLVNGNGIDVLAGAAASLSASVPAAFSITAAPLNGTLTLNISGQSVAGAQGAIFVYFAPPASVRRSSGGGSVQAAETFEYNLCTRDNTQGNWGAGGFTFQGVSITGSADDNPCYYQFPSNGTGYAVLHHLLPASWNSGAGITVTLLWAGNYSGTGNVQWNISTYCSEAGAVLYSNTFTYNTAQTVTAAVAASGTANAAVFTAFPALTQTGCAAPALLQVKIQNAPAGSGGTTYTGPLLVASALLQDTQ
jgi:hypothetical protein